MKYFNRFYLDQEKDIIVNLYLDKDRMFYQLRTPNHSTGNLITNLAKMCDLETVLDDDGLKTIKGEIPCYYNDEGEKVYIFHLKDTKIANIYPDGKIERKASIPAISKTFMSQTKNYHLDYHKTIVKTFIKTDEKFHTDLHTHMNANLKGDILIALGIQHQILYPYYYIKKLGLKCTQSQRQQLEYRRKKVALEYRNSKLTGKYLDRKIDDNTFINFADLVLNNLDNFSYNIPRIRSSLAVMKDGQAVFTNLEKVYLYRYVFTKGKSAEKKISLRNITKIEDDDIRNALIQMQKDRKHPIYKNNTLFEDKLLWIARQYKKTGVVYAEISDTALLKRDVAAIQLQQIHRVMPTIYQETGVLLRFLASFRRIPLTIVRDNIPVNNYEDNLAVLQAIMHDPFIAGSDIVGEEINDIRELKPLLRELTHLAKNDASFVIRIHAGENDSLRDNVYNSIQCVKDSLLSGQTMPHVRIGHGLYTVNLSSMKGKQLLEYIRTNNVVLEFQITSNVRLNNLSDLSSHPLKQYLKADIQCVQGSDGGALYGTDSIDEQLTLEKVLDLSSEQLKQMCSTEEKIIHESIEAFKKKETKLKKQLHGKSVKKYFEEKLQNSSYHFEMEGVKKLDSSKELKNMIVDLNDNKRAVIIAGGSFNNDTHQTKTRREYCDLIDELLEKADPNKIVFVIGSSLKGYEKYLLNHNKGKFEIYAFVPSMLSEEEIGELKKKDVKIRVAIEPDSMGIYKSVAYEVFKRHESILIALDGNSSAINLIQEAKNAKYKCHIFVNPHASMLKKKAETLMGYVELLKDDASHKNVIKYIQKL